MGDVEFVRSFRPMARMGTPEDVANAAKYHPVLSFNIGPIGHDLNDRTIRDRPRIIHPIHRVANLHDTTFSVDRGSARWPL